MNVDRPLVTCLTPAGVAAIATVAITGRDAWKLVSSLFQPRHPRRACADLQVLLGSFGKDATDDVVVTRMGDDYVEIHCHGGVTVTHWIINEMRQRGAEAVSWEEWLRRTGLADSSFGASASGIDAVIALTNALTLRTANILLDQYHGALQREIEQILELLEATPRQLSDALMRLEQLASRIPVGRHLTQPWRVVLAGAPNVGKSTLGNAILGYQRAITSPTPGTTRDLVSARTAIEGWPVELIDTAGYRTAATDLEAEGVQLARMAWSSADLCLWILDQSAEPVLPENELPSPVLPVMNKVDLPAAWDLELLPWQQVFAVSAQTGAGVPGLIAEIGRRLVPVPPWQGAAVPFTEGQHQAIAAAVEALRRQDSQSAIDWLKRILHRSVPELICSPSHL